MVKYSPINQCRKGFSPSMAVNPYLNDNVEGEQFCLVELALAERDSKNAVVSFFFVGGT